jgi:phage terminase large subunit-like protein
MFRLEDLTPEQMSRAERLASLPPAQRAELQNRMTQPQREALKWVWEFWARPDQIVPDDVSIYVRSAGRGSGKALALDTPVPTPGGWTTIGDLRVGDWLYDELGEKCRVTYATGTQYDRPCYRVEFSDGSAIVADGEHRWVTNTAKARKAAGRAADPRSGPEVRTTEQIARTVTTGYRQDRNHSVDVALPLWLPEATLPIHPYVLGAWLGDGSSKDAAITVSDDDLEEMVGHLRASGVSTFGKPRRKAGAKCVTIPMGRGKGVPRDPATGRLLPNEGLWSALKALGVWGNKHVPAIYLRASIDQREALLQGLMDTDGTNCSGNVEFDNTNEGLADAVFELVVSLGWQATRGKKRAMLNGVDYGVMHRVIFNPDRPVFRLARKRILQRAPGGPQSSRRRRRYITAVEPVASVPVRCLTVDSPSHQFLAGRSMIPTHNTREGAEWARKKGPQHREGLLIGANPRDARDLMLEGRSGIVSVTPPWERPVYEPTKLLLRWPNGAIAHVRSAEDPAGIRGLSVEWIWADEIVKWRFLQATWDQSRLALREGRKPQTVVTTTPMPLPLIKKLLKGGRGIMVRPPVSTYRNFANLSPDYLRELLEMYEGTRLGDQELHAMVLDDVKGAIWNHAEIEGARWNGEWVKTPTGLHVPAIALRRRVVGVDPSGSTTGDEWGIVVVGTDGRRPPCGFVLDDRSKRGSPEECAREAVHTYWEHGCEALVVEINYGGEMVERLIRAVPAEGGFPSGETVRVEVVRAGRGQSKYERAVPIHGLFEQNLRGFRRFYLVGNFKELEGQMTTWIPPEQADGIEVFKSSWSPDRMDAMVWASIYLLVLNPRRQARADVDTLVAATV